MTCTRSPAPGTRAGDQIDGFDQAPLATLLIVGATQIVRNVVRQAARGVRARAAANDGIAIAASITKQACCNRCRHARTNVDMAAPWRKAYATARLLKNDNGISDLPGRRSST